MSIRRSFSSNSSQLALSARHAARRFDGRIRELAEKADVLAARTRDLRATPPSSRVDLLEDIERRDAELAVAHAELRALHEELTAVQAALEGEVARRLTLFEGEDACILSDGRAIVEDANAAAGRLLAMPPERMVGKLLISFVARRDTRAFREQLRKLQTQDAQSNLQLQLRPRGGLPFLALVGARAVMGADNQPVGFCWSMRPASTIAPPLDAIRSRMEASMQSLRSSLVEAQAQARILGGGVEAAEAHAGAIRALSDNTEGHPKALDALADAPSLDDAVAQASEATGRRSDH